jgi:hypothetical protein
MTLIYIYIYIYIYVCVCVCVCVCVEGILEAMGFQMLDEALTDHSRSG